MISLKSLVLHDISDLRLENRPMPEISDNQVLLKVMASGVCGSDIPRIFKKGTYTFPTVPGHEFAGQIVETGKNVDPSLNGKKAAVFPLKPCMKCTYCKDELFELCDNYDYYGSRCDGGFSEYIAIDKWNLVMIPDNVSYEEASMLEPMCVSLHSIKKANPQDKNSIVIFGAGPIGLMLAKWASKFNIKNIILVDIDDEKIEFAKNQGFTHVVNSIKEDPVEYVMKVTNNLGADITIEGAGVSITLNQAILSCKKHGDIVFMGNPAMDMTIKLNNFSQILRREINIHGTWNSSFSSTVNDWHEGVKAISNKEMDIKGLVTHRYSFANGLKALDMMYQKDEFYTKVLITNN